MDFNIRPVKIEDAVFINEMRRMDGVMETTLGLFSERFAGSENFIKNLTENDHLLVAEVEESGAGKVVGVTGLHCDRRPRLRHSASIGIMVHAGYQGRGVGRSLLQKIIDLADNWLMLVRLDLTVYVENERAVKLYKSLGFEIEGTKKYAAIKKGKYADEYLMARYNMK